MEFSAGLYSLAAAESVGVLLQFPLPASVARFLRHFKFLPVFRRCIAQEAQLVWPFSLSFELFF
jgi:hypothetical protein